MMFNAGSTPTSTDGGAVRVAIAEDHPMMRDAITQMIAESGDFVLVGRADTAGGFAQGWPAWNATAALIDVELPDGSGLSLAKVILDAHPDTCIVYYSGTTDDAIVGEAINIGARGFLSKQVDPSELLPGLRRAVSGELTFDRVTASLAVTGMSAATREGPELSPREREVLELVAQGKTNEAIASTLSVSANSVKTWLHRGRIKLDAPDRASAVNEAIKLGIIAPQ